jgi:tetratricopeptide (TPR) repeat protein
VRTDETRGQKLEVGMQKWPALILASAFWFLPTAFATSPGDHFSRANQAYEAGDYQSAVALYDSALALTVSAPAFYNRGNAFFKSGQIGRAVADYNRAYVLSPADQDIRANLEFGRAYRPDKTTDLPNPLLRGLTAFLRVPDVSTARLAAGVLFLLAMLGLALGFGLGYRPGFWTAAGLGVLFIYAAASWLSWSAETNPNKAVVTVPEITLRSGPGEDYKEMVIVHDGLEVTIAGRRGDYVLLQAPGGLGGWAPAASVERIFTAR